jgi:hypothetical protein
MSTLRNITRRVKKTFRSCVGAKRITNSNVGTEATQCGKFQRFKEIYDDFKKDSNESVSHIVRNIYGSRSLFDIVLGSPYNNRKETQEQYINRIIGFIRMAEGHRQQFQQDLIFIPDTYEYAQLKEELRYFIPFMFNYYIRMFEELIPVGIKNNNRNLNWNGRSASASNASNISNMGVTMTNIGTRRGSNISISNSIPNWKGGRGRSRRQKN